MAVQRRRHAIVQPPAASHPAAVAQRAVAAHAHTRRLPHVHTSGTEQHYTHHCKFYTNIICLAFSQLFIHLFQVAKAHKYNTQNNLINISQRPIDNWNQRRSVIFDARGKLNSNSIH